MSIKNGLPSTVIGIHGIQGGGKSTLTAGMEQYLRQQGRLVEVFKFPCTDATLCPDTAQPVNAYLREGNPNKLTREGAQILFRDNKHETYARMTQLRTQGYLLLLECYCFERITYSRPQGIGSPWTDLVYEEYVYPEDVSILLYGCRHQHNELRSDGSVETKHIYEGDDPKKTAFLWAVEEEFLKLSFETQETNHWVRIPGQQTREAILAQAVRGILSYMKGAV